MINTRRFSASKFCIDWSLLLGVLSISLIGLVILYSAQHDLAVIERQMVRLALAVGFMLFVAQIPPRIFRSLAPWLYFGGVLLLALVLVLGTISKGGQRWLDLWLVRFQPAELMKLAVPMMLARVFDSELLPPKFSTLIIPILLILVPVGLVAKQPDLGTAVIIFSTGFLVLFFAGMSWRMLTTLMVFLCTALPFIWLFMHEYQKDRVLTFLNPERDPLGAGYHIIQSKIAIGSGGLAGKGWLNGTQSHLEFLPERTTDSIFAVFGEEFGLVGCLILLGLYLCIIIRGLYIGVQAQDTFSRLLSGSLIMTLFVYVFVNIGMVTGILPVVGLPLPMVSFGGTSMVTIAASFGMLMSIHTHRTLLAK